MTDKDVEDVFASYGQFVTGKDYALVRAIAAAIAPQRTWVGLTDEEKQKFLGGDAYGATVHDINAIEAKLKEKNT